MGLTGPGRPMMGLPDDVVLPPDDRIRRRPTADDELGRALPQTVVDQLIGPANLDRLEAAFDADTRAMVELQAVVGRRTAEWVRSALGLPSSSEEVLDETGRLRPAPVLVHDMPEVGIRASLCCRSTKRQPRSSAPNKPGSAPATPTRPPRNWRCSPPWCATREASNRSTE